MFCRSAGASRGRPSRPAPSTATQNSLQQLRAAASGLLRFVSSGATAPLDASQRKCASGAPQRPFVVVVVVVVVVVF
eukprot:15449807-Alexandrium_andersonii.AAC.1